MLMISKIYYEVSDFIESFKEIPERVCNFKGDSVVKLGSHKFLIPSTLRGAYITGNTRLVANLNSFPRRPRKWRQKPYWKVCPTGLNSEFVRNQFSIYAPIRSDLTDTHLPFAANINLNSLKGSQERRDIFSWNSTKCGDWETSGDYQTSVRSFAGMSRGKGWSVRDFITKDKEFVTPSGNPVGFQCELGGRNIPRLKKCRTWFAWSDDLRVSYSFSDQDYPIEEWRVLHEQIVEFIGSIELPDEPKRRDGTNRK
jgi:hypothetical protein